MGYHKSPLDQLSDKLAPSIRKLKDITINLTGTKTAVLRVTQTDEDMFGDKTFSYDTSVINNVIIRYPFSNIEMFAAKDTGQLDNTSIDLFDLLPINMIIPFDAYTSGLVTGEVIYTSGVPIELDENDIIVDVFYDSHGNPIPIQMNISRMYAGFFGRNQTTRRYELTLKRGDEVDEIQDIIDAYISGEATQS